MGAQVVDYRVSTLVVLCKDCGQDVGLYPARHKCAPIERPAMPALPTKYLDQKQQSRTPSLDSTSKTISSTSSISTSPSLSGSETNSSGKWSSRRGNKSPTVTTEEPQNEESIYLNNFTAHLPEADTNSSSGKKLWGKVRQNDKWKQLNEKNDKPKQSGKLWGKLLQATQTMAEKIPNRDEKGAESDEDDWDGETHVARTIREYYEKKRLPLPDWLFDDNTPMKRNPSYRNPSTRQKSPPSSNLEVSSDGPKRAPSRRRLWEQSPETENAMSSREKERQELRKNQSLRKPPSSHHDDYENDHDDRPDRARSMRGDRLNRARSARGENYNDHYKEERYEPKRYDDRYNDHGRDDRYQDRYEDRYREDRHREDRHREDHYREERHYREEAPSRSKSYREEPPSRSKSYKREPLPALAPERHDDRGYYDRPRSPPRHYKERSYDREPAYSDRYTDRNDLDDYYYDSAPRHQIPPVSRERARREPSVRSGRYGKDANYF